MAKTVFILGAGASAQAGAPMMANFLDKARTLLAAKKIDGTDKEDFEKVFVGISLLQRVHSKSELDIYNVESVFSAFEMAKTLNAFPDKNPNEIDKLITSLRRVIVRTLELSVKFPVENNSIGIPPPYKEFLDLVRDLKRSIKPTQTVAILTFNYDICIDRAVLCSGFKIDYGLSEPKEEYNSIPILKLHGSLNWSSSRNDNEIIPWYLEDYHNSHQSISLLSTEFCALPIGSQLTEMNNNTTYKTVTGEPFIVPPTWNKQESHRNISKVWSRAASELSDAENIMVIGYSMPPTDSFFKYLYALGTVGNSLLRRFWVFNPDESVRNRFLELLGPGAEARFFFKPVTFLHSCGDIREYFVNIGAE